MSVQITLKASPVFLKVCTQFLTRALDLVVDPLALTNHIVAIVLITLGISGSLLGAAVLSILDALLPLLITLSAGFFSRFAFSFGIRGWRGSRIAPWSWRRSVSFGFIGGTCALVDVAKQTIIFDTDTLGGRQNTVEVGIGENITKDAISPAIADQVIKTFGGLTNVEEVAVALFAEDAGTAIRTECKDIVHCSHLAAHSRSSAIDIVG